jgi:hypothetical protein
MDQDGAMRGEITACVRDSRRRSDEAPFSRLD